MGTTTSEAPLSRRKVYLVGVRVRVGIRVRVGVRVRVGIGVRVRVRIRLRVGLELRKVYESSPATRPPLSWLTLSTRASAPSRMLEDLKPLP